MNINDENEGGFWPKAPSFAARRDKSARLLPFHQVKLSDFALSWPLLPSEPSSAPLAVFGN